MASRRISAVSVPFVAHIVHSATVCSAILKPNMRTFAIGDIHGCSKALDALLNVLALTPRDELIFLGDYVDRGPDSAGVIDYLLELERTGPLGLRLLRGNHEHAMLAFLDDPGVGPAWAQYGGIETLRSYGVRAPLQQDDPQAWEPVRDALDAALPDAHRDFLERLERYAIHGDYCFVHAGLKPGVPLDEQEDQDLLGGGDPEVEHRLVGDDRLVVGVEVRRGHHQELQPVVVQRAQRTEDAAVVEVHQLEAVILGEARHGVDQLDRGEVLDAGCVCLHRHGHHHDRKFSRLCEDVLDTAISAAW